MQGQKIKLSARNHAIINIPGWGKRMQVPNMNIKSVFCATAQMTRKTLGESFCKADHGFWNSSHHCWVNSVVSGPLHCHIWGFLGNSEYNQPKGWPMPLGCPDPSLTSVIKWTISCLHQHMVVGMKEPVLFWKKVCEDESSPLGAGSASECYGRHNKLWISGWLLIYTVLEGNCSGPSCNKHKSTCYFLFQREGEIIGFASGWKARWD